MSELIEKGNFGECLAADYLEQNGYTVMLQNYHSRYGEIDLIAQTGNIIVFAEVRLRDKLSLQTPSASISVSKQRKIISTASAFLRRYNIKLQPRFDIVEIFTNRDEILKIVHIPNAFCHSGDYSGTL